MLRYELPVTFRIAGNYCCERMRLGFMGFGFTIHECKGWKHNFIKI